ncbi:MAG TPA: hypothetical protein QKA14_02145 [Candidatus Megaira endosymbiont of Hartmannula sinica]|nr:hypothetical protein [Candidatus Megaera endosymbiont of Hartmannula sinica]
MLYYKKIVLYNIYYHKKPLHTTSTITHACHSTLPQPSLTPVTPHYLNHHSHRPLHTTSTITHP